MAGPPGTSQDDALDQIARDEEKLIRLKTLRKKSKLKDSLDARR